MPSLPSGLVTFMFTDMEESTRLHQRLGAQFVGLIAEHDGLLSAAIEEHGGVVVKSMGDGLFAAFAEAVDAVAAAVAVQQAVGGHRWPDDADVRVRVGLHRGEAVPSATDYVAIAVHQAARVLSAAHGGQVLATDEVVTAVTPGLATGFSWHELGRFRLKDFDEPVPLWQLRWPGSAVEFPALRAMPAAAHNVPEVRTRFIGRQRELAAVTARVADNRLVTVSGPGGVGKTRMAFEVARTLATAYPDGAWVVLLASAATAEDAVARVATTVGARDRPGASLQEALVEFLSSRRLLLVLDNCEHVASAVGDLVDAVLDRCPGVTVVATSRTSLGVDGECVYSLRPLAVPEAESTVDGLLDNEAVTLFLERARLVQPDFDPDERSLPVVARICRRLEGIPLALEMAAAQLRVLSVTALDARLDDALAFLSGGSRIGGHRRQQTLRAVVDWSHDLLSEPGRVLFRRLSVFRGGWTLEAAEAVCAFDELPSHRVLSIVHELVADSIVSREESRFGMLEVLRQYAWERLVDAGEEAVVRQRHLQWVMDRDDALAGLPVDEQFAAAETEEANTLAAMEWMLNDHFVGSPRLPRHLLRLRTRREGASAVLPWLERSAERFPDAPPAWRAHVLMLIGYLHASLYDVEKGLPLLRRALEFVTPETDPHLYYEIVVRLGEGRARAGDAEASVVLLATVEEAGELLPPDRRARCLLIAAWGETDLRRAEELAVASAELATEAGDTSGRGGALLTLANIKLARGDDRGAEIDLRRSIAISRQQGAEENLARALMFNEAALQVSRGDDDAAIRCLETAAEIFERTGSRRLRAQSLLMAAAVDAGRGNVGRAHAAIDRAVPQAHTVGDAPLTLDLAAGLIVVREFSRAEHLLTDPALRDDAKPASVGILRAILTAYRGDQPAAARLLRTTLNDIAPNSGQIDHACAGGALLALDSHDGEMAVVLAAAARYEFVPGVIAVEVRRRVRTMGARLGEEAYQRLWAEGCELPRPAAAARLADFLDRYTP